MNKSHTTDKKSSLNDLIDIVRHLRDPQKGCEWDIKQTAKSLNTHIIEEAYELVEAIDAENIAVSYTHLRAHETGRSRMPSSA